MDKLKRIQLLSLMSKELVNKSKEVKNIKNIKLVCKLNNSLITADYASFNKNNELQNYTIGENNVLINSVKMLEVSLQELLWTVQSLASGNNSSSYEIFNHPNLLLNLLETNLDEKESKLKSIDLNKYFSNVIHNIKFLETNIELPFYRLSPEDYIEIVSLIIEK